MKKILASASGNGGSSLPHGVRLPASGEAITINGYLVRGVGEPGAAPFYHVTRG